MKVQNLKFFITEKIYIKFIFKLIRLFPNDVSNIIEISSLVSLEDQKEDFVKEMPLVAEYCK